MNLTTRIEAVLSDGLVHTQDDIVAGVDRFVSPGRALVAYHSTSARHRAMAEAASEEALRRRIRAGVRRIVLRAIKALLRRGKVAVSGRGRSAEYTLIRVDK